MAENETEEQKRKRLPITILAVYDSAHRLNKDYVSSGLDNLGLIKGIDYEIYNIPASMNEINPVPIIKVNERNPWGLKNERFYGKEGIDILLNELKIKRAA